MTNLIALLLGIALAAGIGIDLLANDGAALVFLARKFLGLVDAVAFWH
jgi:hypothetical protein